MSATKAQPLVNGREEKSGVLRGAMDWSEKRKRLGSKREFAIEVRELASELAFEQAFPGERVMCGHETGRESLEALSGNDRGDWRGGKLDRAECSGSWKDGRYCAMERRA